MPDRLPTLPTTARIRLEVVSAITGDPVSTLRDAIAAGLLKARRVGKVLYTTVDWHSEWVDDESARRGDGAKPAERKVQGKAADVKRAVLRANGGTSRGRAASGKGSTEGKERTSASRGAPIVDLRRPEDRADALRVVEGGILADDNRRMDSLS